MAYTRPQVISGFNYYGSSSSGTGVAHFIGDARLLTLSIITNTATDVSRYTISLSNDDGFQAAVDDASWSIATTLLGRGIYTIDPGARWIRTEQPAVSLSTTSNVTMILNRYMQCD